MNIPPVPNASHDWRDPATLNAALGWLRLGVGAAFAAVLLYMLASGRIDPSAFIKAILSIMTIDAGANGVLHLVSAANQRKS